MQGNRMMILALLVVALAACQGPPPTQIVLVVTATPTPEDALLGSPTAESQAAASATSEASPSATSGTASAGTVTPQALPSAQPSPTAIVSQIQVAEQVFENGRMFWLQPSQQVWVMLSDGSGQGEWLIYEDTFVEGDIEFDPSIVPPQGFEQPERGFGKLWRENPELRDSLGWAITPEFGHVTRYEYHADAGYHVLVSLYEEEFRFNEADRRWQLN